MGECRGTNTILGCYFRSYCSPSTALAAPDLVGAARVVDGDTLVAQDVKVRLEGIDAPEHGQTCTANGVPWACGDTATAWLRVLATCFLGGENLNDRIVREGSTSAATRVPIWKRDEGGSGCGAGTPWEWREC